MSTIMPMDSIVEEAMEQDETAVQSDSDEFEQFGDPNIVVVGCGGAGNNTVDRLHSIGVEGARTIAINTDKQHLERVDADDKILVGSDITEGLGAGGDPDVGRNATKKARGTIKKEVLQNADLVFVTAGMGGGTGTGAAPVVSSVAKDVGAIVVGMVSLPFEVERHRLTKAEEGIDRLSEVADSIIVLDNNRLLDYVPNLPLGKAFSVMDQIISETVKGISETITRQSLVNLDYADMRSIMSNGGVAVMLVGETQDKNKKTVVNEALDHPLLDVDYRGATGGLVHITGGPDLTLDDVQGIASKITERLDRNAQVILGSRVRDEYKGKVRVMAIMTGVNSTHVVGSNESQESFTTDNRRTSTTQTDTSSNVDTIQ